MEEWSRVRLDPPANTFEMRGYPVPVNISLPLEAMNLAYNVAGNVVIAGTHAVLTMTMGEITAAGLRDLDEQLRLRGVEFVHWVRHRKDGTRKPVTRRIT